MLARMGMRASQPTRLLIGSGNILQEEQACDLRLDGMHSWSNDE